jgi:hypothetical protein
MNREKHSWIYDVLFLLVFVLAGLLRLTGVNWGEGQHQHPDENFLSGVLGSLRAHACEDEATPVEVCPEDQLRWMSLGEYFDSKTSTLNPYNRGYAFFVYGNLPMTIARIASEAAGQTDVKTLGRQLSAVADLFTIFFLYMLVSRMYGRKVGLLASLFSALTAMQIQQSHFFTTDLFVNTFAFLAIWFAVEILNRPKIGNPRSLIKNPLLLLSIGFGFAFGMALASKVNIYPLAILLPGAFALRYFITDRHALTVDDGLQNEIPLSQREKAEGEGETPIDESSLLEMDVQDNGEVPPDASPLVEEEPAPNRPRSLITDIVPLRDYWLLIAACLIAGGLAAFISFRIFQPYAFDGLLPNQQWIANIQEQRAQAKGDADLPWNLQWARRSHLYSFMNLTTWGLGLPLGILAWMGFLYMGWRIFKGEWRHALLWGWTAAYFVWQSLQFNPTMRYQLPIYPLLAMMAAWFVFELAGLKFGTARPAAEMSVEEDKPSNVPKVLVTILGLTVLALTAVWAFAFQSIYLRDEPRMAASRWIFQNVPGPINVEYQTDDGSTYNQPLPFPVNGFIQAGVPYDTTFTVQTDGIIDSITLGHAANTIASPLTLSLILSDVPAPTPEQALATASLTDAFSTSKNLQGESYTLELDHPIAVTKGQPYHLRFDVDSGSLILNGASVVNETDYDYGLPFRIDGYDAFGGIYRGDLNLQVYWDDNADKLERFVSTLGQADYIFIPTNH